VPSRKALIRTGQWFYQKRSAIRRRKKFGERIMQRSIGRADLNNAGLRGIRAKNFKNQFQRMTRSLGFDSAKKPKHAAADMIFNGMKHFW